MRFQSLGVPLAPGRHIRPGDQACIVLTDEDVVQIKASKDTDPLIIIDRTDDGSWVVKHVFA